MIRDLLAGVVRGLGGCVAAGKCPRCGLVNPASVASCRACGLSFSTAAATRQPASLTQHSATLPATPPPQVSTNFRRAAASLPGLLLPFSTRTVLRGVVIHVDGPYMAQREFGWAKLAVRVAVFLIFSPILVSVAAMWFVLLVVASLLGIHSRGRGFISGIATQVVGFFLTSRLLGPKAQTPVRDLRVKDGTGAERLVRIQGEFTAGNVNVGDDITVEGADRRGTIILRRGFNHRTRSEIRVRQR